jgi:WD40 repeat protein
MLKVLSLVLSVSVVFILLGPPLRGEEPGKGAGMTNSLPPGALARFGTSRFLNFGRVFSVAFSPDGKSLAAGAWDGTLRLWKVPGGKELRQLGKQRGQVRSVAFSPDGKILACGSGGSGIIFWDPATGKELRRLVGPTAFLTFSPDGKLLASKGGDETHRIWDVASGREVRRLGRQRDAQQDGGSERNLIDFPVVFSADGKTAASATVPTGPFGYGTRPTFRLWEVATGKEVRSFKGKPSSFGPAAFSPDGKLLAVGAGWPALRNGTFINLWDVNQGAELRPIEEKKAGMADAAFSLAFSLDGKILASSGGGPLIQLWEIATRRELCRFEAPDAGRASLAFSPDGRLLASGSTDITVLLWDLTGRMQGGKLRPEECSPQQFQTFWADLGSQDVPKAWRALWALVAADDRSVAFLRERLHPAVNPTSAETIARLVADLDSAQYSVRSKAAARLIQLGEWAEPALLDVLKKQPSLELRQRIDQLYNQLVNQRYSPSGERLRDYRAIEVLEQIGTPQARQLLETLSRGQSAAMLTREAKASLARLERRGWASGEALAPR